MTKTPKLIDGIAIPEGIKTLPIDGLIPYAKNARVHSGEQISEIAASIRLFGFNDPVGIDGEGGIIEGHGRIMAAKEIGMTEVPIIRLPHMDEDQKRAYIIAHNRLAEKASWDSPVLYQELQHLIEQTDIYPSVVGYNEDDLAALRNLATGDDLNDGYGGDGGGGDSDGAGERQSDTTGVIGTYRFEISRQDFLAWEDEIRAKVGFEKADIIQEIKDRLLIAVGKIG